MPAERSVRGVAVRAAGGVVWRMREGRLHVALVHRPRYDDWSLPKGKLDPGESELTAAVREVREELGSSVALSRRLEPTRYATAAGRKTVAYWVMRHRTGTFTPNDEVDQVVWTTPDNARRRASYSADRSVLADFLSRPVPDSVVVLVRHARAGKRADWKGDDLLRPLEAAGRAQARRLATFLAAFDVQQVVSARPERCRQTVQPFAREHGLDIGVEAAFDDSRFSRSPKASVAALLALAKPRQVTVVSSQGEAIPGLIDRLAPHVRSTDTRKGAAWVLSFADGELVAADHYAGASR